MTTAKHAKPVPVVTSWPKAPSTRWEHCPKCNQVRAVGSKWLRACKPDKKATHYMGL
jgi:hypothetical protein